MSEITKLELERLEQRGTMMTRKKHLQWAKNRSFEILDKGNALQAWISFVSDLSKHDKLKTHIAIELGNMVLPKDKFAVNEYRNFIAGFN